MDTDKQISAKMLFVADQMCWVLSYGTSNEKLSRPHLCLLFFIYLSLSVFFLSPGALLWDTKCWVYMCTKRTHWEAGLTATSETFLGDDPRKLDQPVIELSRGIWKSFVNTPLEHEALSQVRKHQEESAECSASREVWNHSSKCRPHLGHTACLLVPRQTDKASTRLVGN